MNQVNNPIPKGRRTVGFQHVARWVKEALDKAFELKGEDATVAVAYQNSMMYPIYT